MRWRTPDGILEKVDRQGIYLGCGYENQMACACSFTAVPGALSAESRLVVCAQYSTEVFGENRWATSLLRPIQGHKLVTRRDLIPSEPDHLRAGTWYYALQLSPGNTITPLDDHELLLWSMRASLTLDEVRQTVRCGLDACDLSWPGASETAADHQLRSYH